ncbi:XrtA/PEP-CTERM system TPR-repeat protein PrsT [Colwellia psychrerythraea]|uniref:TPR domain protein n=1 Tax=Colwellia psychrerythraea (strain 34H / ATCC BAA-681) TaxID=167879 RepID=Q48A37_COLP3|nr:XrtA/PEP-CTERM system TPR-repeat protein PrsT [Colwellia psychrerythraea]AAZ25078.1 TPR domain protein [Colwellia psychrerythraea 34H]
MKKYIKPSAILLTLILSACSETKTVQQLISSGNSFVQVRDFSSAVIEFKNAVRLEPKNANARFELGNAYLEQGNFVNAEKEFSRAVELGLDFSNIAALMARVNTHLDKADEVYQLVERSDELTDDDYVEVLTYAGITALKQNRISQGQDYLTQAIVINPDAAYSRIAQAYVHYADREFSQGIVVISNLLNEKTDATEAMLIQGHLYYAQQEFEHASGAFALYLNYHPQDHKIRFFEVNSLIKAEKFEQANVITNTLLKAFKDSSLALQFKAQLEYQKKNYSAARDYAEEALQHGQDFLGAKIIAGVSSYFLGDVEQAYTKLNGIVERVPNNLLVKKILAVTKFELGYYADAAENFSSLEGLTSADLQLLKSSSASLMGIGYVDNALSLINKAEEFSPDNAQVAAQKGLMLLSQNDISGINSMKRAVELDPSLTYVQVALAIGYLNIGEENKAQKIADLYKDKIDEADVGHVLEGFIYLNNKQSANAQVSFEKALSLNPKNIASLYNLGLLHKRAAENSKAIIYFDRLIALSPEHKGALKSLVSIAVNKEYLEEVLTILVRNHQTDNLYSIIALAQVLRIDQQVAKAVTTLGGIDKSVKLTSNYFMLLGDSYLELEKYLKANAIFEQGLALEPKDYLLNIRYISTLEWLGDYTAALDQTRRLHKYYPNNINITTSLIYLEVRNKNYQEAKYLLEAIKGQKSNHHQLDAIAGEIYSYEKDYPQAIEHFSVVYEKEPTELNLLNLARTLGFDKQNKQAERLLELYLDKNPNNSKIRFLLAELYNPQDRKKRVVQYQVLSTQIPNNAIVFNNLAWNQFKLKQTAEALINIEKAYQLQPDSLAIQESYGVILIANNKLSQGINILESAILSGSTDAAAKEYLIKAKTLLNNQGKSSG